jgi:hypothetical protein
MMLRTQPSRPTKQRRYSNADIATIKEMRARGKSWGQVGAIFKASASSVKNAGLYHDGTTGAHTPDMMPRAIKEWPGDAEMQLVSLSYARLRNAQRIISPRARRSFCPKNKPRGENGAVKAGGSVKQQGSRHPYLSRVLHSSGRIDAGAVPRQSAGLCGVLG